MVKTERPLVAQAGEQKLRVLQLLQRSSTSSVMKDKVAKEISRVQTATHAPATSFDRLADLRREHDKLQKLRDFVEKNQGEGDVEIHAIGFSMLDDRLQQVLSVNPEATRRELLQTQKTLFDIQGRQVAHGEDAQGDLTLKVAGSKRKALAFLTRVRRGKIQRIEPTNQEQLGTALQIARPEFAALDRSLRKLERSIGCQAGTDNAYVQSDVCEFCDVPFVCFAKESLLTCPSCARQRTHLSQISTTVREADGEGSRAVTERKKAYRTWLQQFKEGTRVPDEVFIKLNQEFARGLHMYAVPDLKITRVRELLKSLGLQEWLPYSQRITMQLLRCPMPSLTREEIDSMIEMYDLILQVHERDPGAEKTLPTPKRVTEMIFLWRAQLAFAKCFPAAAGSKRQAYQVFDRVSKLLTAIKQAGHQAA